MKPTRPPTTRSGAAAPAPRLSTAGRGRILAGAILIVSAAAFGVGQEQRRWPRGLVRARFTAGRLAFVAEWRRCVVTDTAALIPRTACGDTLAVGSADFERLADATAASRVRVATDSTTAGKHARALLELRWHRLVGESLDRAVAHLEAARSGGAPAVVNDLAVAYLELAERDQAILPLLRALDVLAQARGADVSRAVRFNRALVMERLYLLASARRAWGAYAEAEDDDAWLGEARMRAAALDRVLRAGAAPSPASHADLAAMVRGATSHTREIGIRALGEWGRAVLRGDAAAAAVADSLLRVSLARDTSGVDAATRRALTADAAGDDPTRRVARARAYVALADGHRRYAAAAWDSALAPLALARASLRAIRSPLAGWAALYYGSSQLNLGQYTDADRTLAALAADSAASEPALVSRALLALGVSQVRRGNFERANEFYQIAMPHLVGVREPETVGYGAYLRSEGFDRAGQAKASQDEALRALRVLAPLRRSIYLNNQLTEVAAVARAAGLHHAALLIMDEVVEVAGGVGRPQTIALALSRRARDQYGVGRTEAGAADLRAAAQWAARMRPGRGHARIRAAVQLTTGELTRPHDPASALPLLEAAARTFREFDSDLYLPSALYELALAAEALGDRATARARLDEAVGAVERMQGAFRGSGGRAVFAERVERISDRAIALALDAGRPDEAFAYLERARAAVLGPATDEEGPAAPPAGGIEALGRALPADLLLAEYALLDDRLVIWSTSTRGARAHVIPVRRDAVAALVARMADELRTDAPPRADRSSARLFELLLGPLRAELANARRIVVVPDRELHHVPFAALWDPSGGRYLVEHVEVRGAPSAAFLVGALRRRAAGAGEGRALVIGDPALDTRDAAARLGRLPWAVAEASRIAQLYPSVRLVTGRAASRSRVTEELSRARVVHFAGHAVFNTSRPELSYVALARDEGGGELTAGEIATLRLSRTSVVVLSACSTLNPSPTRAGAAAGLAYSFLRAGVPATVSTLWEVSDAGTADLLVEFHRALAAGVGAGTALRTAQLRALRSPNPLLRAPRTWAVFTLTGH